MDQIPGILRWVGTGGRFLAMGCARIFLLAAAGLGLSAEARGACFSRSQVSALEARLAEAEKAFVDLDDHGFSRALDDASLLLPCLDAVAPPAVAARFHRLHALRLNAAGESESAEASLRAARVLDPAYRFPDEVLPADHELRRTYESLPSVESRSERPPQPRDGALAFDGTLTARRPLDRSTIVQLVTDEGVSTTRLVEPSQPLPRYASVPRDRQRLLATSGALLAVSGAFYAAAWATNAPFWDREARSQADLEALQARSVAFTALSGTAFGLSATGVVVAFGVAGSGRAD